jgi:hypothetical protein
LKDSISADQQMNMFWHDKVANHHELVEPPPRLFQNFEKQVASVSRAQQRVAAVMKRRSPGSVIRFRPQGMGIR